MSLGHLTEAAWWALFDMDEAEAEVFERKSEWRKVAYRYLAADCQRFAYALHVVTG